MNLHTEDGGEQIDQPISDPISTAEAALGLVALALTALCVAAVAGFLAGYLIR